MRRAPRREEGGGWRVFVLEEKEEPMGHWGHRASWEAAAGQWGPSCGVWKEGAPGEGGSGWVTRQREARLRRGLPFSRKRCHM